MSRHFTRGAQLIIDLFVLSFVYWLAFLLRFEFDLSLMMYKLLFFTWPYVVVFQYLILVAFGVPRFSWRFIAVRESMAILGALAVSSTILIALRIGLASFGGYSRFVTIPLGVLAMNFIMGFLGVAGVRVIRRITAERTERAKRLKNPRDQKRTLLIGAGSAGVMVAREVTQNPNLGIKVVGFVDDNVQKTGTVIQGCTVLGTTASMEKIVSDQRVDQAIISIAQAPGKSIRRILQICESIALPVKIIPGIYEILDGKVNLSRIREVTIEDLLGREAVQLDLGAIGEFVSGKCVVITGAGGSIGSELCRQVSRFNPTKLVMIEQAENALFEIHRELSRVESNCELVPCVADICDQLRMDQVFAWLRPEVVFHAAAHKHVPLMEWNPGEALKNNVFGTQVVADMASKHSAEAFVMVSTDKAVNPSSIMGTSKRVAEIYCQALSRKSSTKFVAVRFGNVLGSAGSVIPVFKEQIRRGGPVTVTHPEMKRYFMTIPEACQLVMQAASMGRGGEIFVLDMGEPVKIVDLAKDLIRLSGFAEDEIDIEFTGTRPGEKLFEELAITGEQMTKTRHPKIFIGRIAAYPFDHVEAGISALRSVINTTSGDQVRRALAQLVPEMQSSSGADQSAALSDSPPSHADVIH